MPSGTEYTVPDGTEGLPMCFFLPIFSPYRDFHLKNRFMFFDFHKLNPNKFGFIDFFGAFTDFFCYFL